MTFATGPRPDNRGAGNPAAKLTEDDAIAVLALLDSGHTQADIANQFGITQSAVSQIKTGRKWAHLPRGNE